MKKRKCLNNIMRRSFLLLLAAAVFAAAAPGVFAEDAGDVEPLLPLWLLEECETPGTLEIVEYTSANGVPARAGVLLPHGYDEESLYDVAFLWPGTAGDYEKALLDEYTCFFDGGESHPLSAKQLIDRMTEEKLLRPFILVCMEDTTGGNSVCADCDTAAMLDYVKENYATYASAELSQEKLREHFFFLGISQGAIFAEAVGLGLHFDDFASIAAISYGSHANAPDTLPESSYELRLLYACCGGRRDHGAESSRRSYELLTALCGDKIRPGDNAFFRELPSYRHGYALMVAGLCDCLPMMLAYNETVEETK